MNLDSIKEKVSSLFDSTPTEVGTGFGFKIKDGKLTDEVGFTFIVPKKKPVSELTNEEIFPEIIEHNGVEYSTDVIEIPEISPLGLYCFGTDPIAPADPQVSPNCYSWATTPPINRNYTRPLKGGTSLGISTFAGVGTLGFIAVDVDTQGLVGVTNNHVVISSSNDAFFTGERNLNSVAIFNESFPTSFVQQPGVGDVSPNLPQYQIGRTLRYQPLRTPINGVNTVDGAIISLSQFDSAGNTVIDINESWKQVGLTGITTPPQFATLGDLNSMVSGGFNFSNTEIISAGRTTGAKEGPCSDRLHLLTCTVSVGPYNLQGGGSTAIFVDQMSVVRVSSGNTLCTYPSCRGDSGSAMFAEFGGQWKIIGILFAGGAGDPQTGALPTGPGFPTYYNGCSAPSPFPSIFTFVNKITNVASELGIQAWDGTSKPFVDPNSIQYVSVCGGNFTKTLTCSGDTYWQVGLTNSLISPCNP